MIPSSIAAIFRFFTSRVFPPHRAGPPWLWLTGTLAGIVLLSLWLFTPAALAQTPIPGINISVGKANSPDQVASTLQVVFLLTVLTLAPAIMIMTTSFIRIIIVLAFLRQALGTQQTPPNQVLAGLALFLTFFIMQPTWNDVNEHALKPYLDKRISQSEALDKAADPMKKFMGRFTREKDLALFIRLANIPRPKNVSDVPFYVMVPAFMIGELKTAFQIGFILYIPFLVVDLVVASVLMSMGMMMLPPVMISLPLKLMLFVLVDGWNLIIGSLAESFMVRGG
ncbi:MAG: flagellar type III secretion system pore protein FliP [Deltaproteobacteria bacterium]|nr:flagellar type III secretion system pore protein FliP [Deltaproteobacteria bacterium]